MKRNANRIRFRVSSLSGGCDRAIYCYASGVPQEPFNEATKQAFREGHEAEPKIIKYVAEGLRDGPFVIAYSNGDIGTIQTPHAEIVGHVDGLGRSIKTNERYLFEVKNLAPTRISKLKAGGIRVAEPAYYTQIQVYMHGLLAKGWPYDKCIWAARNRKFRKDSDPKKYYIERVPYDEEEAVRCINKAEEIALAIMSKDIIEPPRNPFTEFFCQEGWCSFSKSCKGHWRGMYG